jgi:hypothetical protein
MIRSVLLSFAWTIGIVLRNKFPVVTGYTICTPTTQLYTKWITSTSTRTSKDFEQTFHSGKVRASKLFLTSSSSITSDDEQQQPNHRGRHVESCHRRTYLFGLAICGMLGSLAPPVEVVTADTGADVRGTPVNAFNGLAFQYRGSEFGGLRASDINEPSISYLEFVSKLKSGDVTFVEFLAPDGDIAYASIKNSNSKIRIGEGYPIEQHDGYSSPAFAIRTVKNAGVPYKFIVPALS